MAPARQPVPARLHREGDRILADWVDIAGTDPTLPFLGDRIARAGAGWRSPLPVAGGVAEPAALILHAGRCGSTVVSRALSRLARCHVLCEPQALNDLLGVDGVWPFLSPEERRDALRRVVDALGRAARPDQDRVVLKLTSWNALQLPLLAETFPTVPKLFVYRPPVEILVSLRDGPAGWMRRADNRMQAKLFLGAPARPLPETPLAFAAAVLGRTLAAVADAVAQVGRADDWLLVPHASLPDALTTRILPFLGLDPSPAEAEALAGGLAIHAKDPDGRRPFVPDGARKRAAATEDLARLARAFADGPYERLEDLRRRGAGGGP